MRSKLGRLGGLCLAFITTLSLIFACTPTPAEEPAPPVTASPFPVEMTDQAGRVVRIEKMPEKIISLAPGNTEILYALGLEDRLVGVTEYCDYPEVAKEKPPIGGFSINLFSAMAQQVDEIYLMVAGLPLQIKSPLPKRPNEVE